jgi:hypothetical protein
MLLRGQLIRVRNVHEIGQVLLIEVELIGRLAEKLVPSRRRKVR